MINPLHPLNYRAMMLSYHTRKASELQEQIDRTSDVNERAKLQHELTSHERAVNALDRAAQTKSHQS